MIEVNFKDRIPREPGQVTLTPVAGATNTYKLERNDDPSERGTPLNKATFDSIIHSRLTGRYYEASAQRRPYGETITANVNSIPASGWTNQSFLFSTNGNYSACVNSEGGNYPSYALDGDNSSYWESAEGQTEHWMWVEFPEAIKVRRVALRVDVDSSATVPTITIEGGNTTSNWTALRTINEAQGAYVREYDLTTTGDFKYYRIRISYNAVNVSRIYTFGVVSYDMSQYENPFIVEGTPAEWDVGQRIMLKPIASTTTFGVVANTLNGVPVMTILQPNRQYELVYNGSAFVAKEV